MEAVWLTDILNRLESLKKADKSLSDAIELLKDADRKAAERIVTLEKKMPSYLDHIPTVNDDSFRRRWQLRGSGLPYRTD